MQNNDQRRFTLPPMCLLLACLASVQAAAGPAMVAGDPLLRHDVQLLADRGILRGPVTTWPLAWGPILADLRRIESVTSLPPAAVSAVIRLKRRADWETRYRDATYSASASAAVRPTRIRGYDNTPRGAAEIGGGFDWTADWLSVSLHGQALDPESDDPELRADGSALAAAIGNWSVSLNSLDRWWGPGWDGSLILSNNARPIPAVSLDRIFTEPFESRWLRWLGPWDINVMMGQLEGGRAVPDALLFGMRFNFRPLRSLEIGLSRTAQWCGDDRPCDLDTFADLLLGRDNLGDAGIGAQNEPGNQLAGIDLRWSTRLAAMPVAVYGQFIGEDEAGGFPSRFLGQFGLELYGGRFRDWSWRWFGEFAATSCQFYESSEVFDCAYNHGVYQTGYRYRGRSIGHAADNDARLVSSGLLLVNDAATEWRALLRLGELNRGGSPQDDNSLTRVPQDVTSIDIAHVRAFRFGTLEVGGGVERTRSAGADAQTDTRFHLQWRSAY